MLLVPTPFSSNSNKFTETYHEEGKSKGMPSFLFPAIMRSLSFLFLLLSGVLAAHSSIHGLKQRLSDIIGQHDVGVCVITGRDTIGLNLDKEYELCSVMKFHQAVALAQYLGYPAVLQQEVDVKAEELRSDTWSPMRAEARDHDFRISVPGLLNYTLQMSDNNACDVLFDRFITPIETDSILRLQGLSDFGIAFNEAEMHADPSLSRCNYSTPRSAAAFMDNFFRNDTTMAGAVVKAVMVRKSEFGRNRIPAGVSSSTGVYHKTGTGFDKPGNVISAVNDVAFITYPRPDGSIGGYTLAVFISDWAGGMENAEKLIADISEATWDAMSISDFLAFNSQSRAAAIERRQNTAQIVDDSSSVGGILGEILVELLWNIIDSKLYPDSNFD